MGWFSKKPKEEKKKVGDQKNTFPELPKLPELPRIEEREELPEPIHQLPRFPNSSIGEKMSQDTIKEAIKGNPDMPEDHNQFPVGKRGGKVFEADDFVPPRKKVQMMPKPPKKKTPIKFGAPPKIQKKPFVEEEFDEEPEFEEMPEEFAAPRIRKNEPVFIRIDKFETSLKTFEKTKKEILEIEQNLKEIAKIKDEEEKELDSWQKEIVKIKDQIAKIDEDIFSKID